MPHTRTRSKAAWILGLALASVALTIATSWAILLQVVLLWVAIQQLTRKPPKKDRVFLLFACGVVVISLAWVVATTLVIYGYSSNIEITSVPLPS